MEGYGVGVVRCFFGFDPPSIPDKLLKYISL